MERKQVANWMRLRVDDYVDGCGEVNCTALAEAAADELDLYEDHIEYKIQEIAFEVAFETSEWLKKQPPLCVRCHGNEVRRERRFGFDQGRWWCTDCGHRWDSDESS